MEESLGKVLSQKIEGKRTEVWTRADALTCGRLHRSGASLHGLERLDTSRKPSKHGQDVEGREHKDLTGVVDPGKARWVGALALAPELAYSFAGLFERRTLNKKGTASRSRRRNDI